MDDLRCSVFSPLANQDIQGASDGLPMPNAAQLAFQELELGLFIHYGIMTYGRSARSGQESPLFFSPSDLDCDNWMHVAKAMGARFAVLTTRHEEGFCLWPTRTTDYSIRNSAYRNGQGDVVREFVEACRRHGIKPCLYHSSYMDAHHLFKPGDPINWHKDWFHTTNRRYAEPGTSESFTNMQSEQIRELLTDYGEITYLWLDHITETQGILYPAVVEDFWSSIVKTARACQPQCLLLKCDVYLSRDPEVRGGVHGGRAAYPLWHACRRVDTREGQCDPIPDPVNGDQYLVWESNTIFSGNWFWENDDIKPVDDMLEHYFATIGRGSTFLPNFAPSPSGKMNAPVLAAAQAFGQRIQALYAKPVAVVESNCDGVAIPLNTEPFCLVEIMEDLEQGQKIAAYVIEISVGGQWQNLASGESIGHKRLHQTGPVSAEAIRIRCTKTLAANPVIRRFAVYQ